MTEGEQAEVDFPLADVDRYAKHAYVSISPPRPKSDDLRNKSQQADGRLTRFDRRNIFPPRIVHGVWRC